MSPLAMFSMTGRQSFGTERSVSNNSMDSYWTNMSSSFRVNSLLSSHSKNDTRYKKDDDEYNASMVMMTCSDDASLSDNGSDNGNHDEAKSNSTTPTLVSVPPSHSHQQRGFYDMIDDRYIHGNATSNTVANIEIATTYIDDRCQETPSQQSLPHHPGGDTNTTSNDEDDVVDEPSSSRTGVKLGSPRSVLSIKVSASRMLKVTTQRLTEQNKLKLE